MKRWLPATASSRYPSQEPCTIEESAIRTIRDLFAPLANEEKCSSSSATTTGPSSISTPPLSAHSDTVEG